MTTSESADNQSRSSEMMAVFRNLQNETILFAIPGLLLIALLLLSITPSLINSYWALLSAAVLFMASAVLYYLRRVSFLLSSILLTIVSTAAVLVAALIGGFPLALFLLVIPIGISTMTLGVAVGIALTSVFSILFFFDPFHLGTIEPNLRPLTIMTLWSVVGMIWLTLRPLVSSVQWAWDEFERSQELLKKARDYQQQLHQSIEDLTNANTQLRRLNQLAQSLRHFAEEERRAKEQFVANVSHELRTPLNMIVGFCETILQTPESYGKNIPPTLLVDLDVVLRNSQHLTNLIDDVLDLSQIDAGQMALTKEYTNITEIISQAVIAVRPLFESKGLYLHTILPEGIPSVFCDRTRIREVILNLLSNAGRFTDMGGVVIKVQVEEAHIIVSVTDTGPGIAEADKNKLFRPFGLLDNGIHRRYGGTGLGLSISKSFVELHDGKMWVESEPNAGSTFFFRLPVVPPAPLSGGVLRWFNSYTPYEQKHHLPDIPPGPLLSRIVVVENGNILQRLFNRYLQNYEVVAVPELEDAVIELAQIPARALIVNNIEINKTLEKLQQGDGLPYNTPAIICSIPWDDQNSQEMGVFHSITKPVSRKALLDCLDRLPSSPKSILIVDDDPDALLLYRRILTNAKRGYRVLRASNGRQALELAQRQTVDVILLDLFIPELNGFQFLSIRSQDPQLQKIPVILISARDPQGQPLASNAFAVTRGGGLSVTKLLACIEAVNSILSPIDPPADLTPSTDLRG